MASAASETREKRRPRWGLRIGIVVLVLVVLAAIAAVVAEFVLRGYVEDRIRDEVRSAVDLDANAPVDVTVAGALILPQVLAGELDRIDVAADDVSFGDLSGTATGTGLGVPIAEGGTVDSLDIDFVIDEDTVTALSANLSELPITSVSLVEPDIVADLEFDVLGFGVPLTVGIEPSAAGPNIEFRPTSVRLGDLDISADTLRDRFGAVAGDALDTRDFCVAEYLPEAFALDSVAVVGDELHFAVTAENAPLTQQAMETLGSCG
ncbi:LmeA family phospholipid-binding protein [Marisediminicola senii]|uniref:LmeA family phospholipid-binding protein n=1 Tax=Marisediminicola senii TaxID=2711233 RepID=UPI0013EDACF3|nr:DUF2993 domain-containing protein [Marisediminicola senii]